MDLKGRSALVTGAGRGIGRAIAVAFAKAGADVAINYAGNEAAAKETEELCAAFGVKTMVIKADVSDAESCKAMVEQVKEAFGKIDILVNNAGITKDKLMIGMTETDFTEVLESIALKPKTLYFYGKMPEKSNCDSLEKGRNI